VEPVLKSDIFFFITSIAVVVLSVFLIIALFYVINILKDLKEVSTILHKGAIDANTKVRSLKEYFTNKSFITSLFKAKRQRKKEKKEE
jgi:hypothetical protein